MSVLQWPQFTHLPVKYQRNDNDLSGKIFTFFGESDFLENEGFTYLHPRIFPLDSSATNKPLSLVVSGEKEGKSLGF